MIHAIHDEHVVSPKYALYITIFQVVARFNKPTDYSKANGK